jgi:hypothetical protein
MTSWTKRNHQVEQGLSGDAMMDNDRALPPPGSATDTAAMTVAFQNLLSQAAEIFVVLPFQGITGGTKAERKDLLVSAAAMQRPLHSAL